MSKHILVSISLLSSQVPSPFLCMRTSYAQSATDWLKARPASRGGSACPVQRWTADTPATSWPWRWDRLHFTARPGLMFRLSFGDCSCVKAGSWTLYKGNLTWLELLSLSWEFYIARGVNVSSSLFFFSTGELPPLSGQPVPSIPPPGLPAAVPPSIPPCWRAERTHSAQSSPQLRWHFPSHQPFLLR